MKQKQIKTKGGIAKPLGDNYFLMRGATHEQGGIDIGNNIEVENGEIIKLNPKSIKVLSNAPIMKGISPAKMALGGLNDGTFEKRFNAGFKYQEKFKDINGLKDDGTKAKFGKLVKKVKKFFIGGDDDNTKLPEFKLGEMPNNYEYYPGYLTNYQYTHQPHWTTGKSPYRPLEYDYGFSYVGRDIEEGHPYLYEEHAKDEKYYVTKEGDYYRYPYAHVDNAIPDPERFTEVPYSEIRKMLPKRDYIGGTKREVGIKTIDKIPGLKDTILNLSKTYGISPNVFTNRLIHEGWIQQIANDYNYTLPIYQKDYAWDQIMNNYVDGFNSLGTDTFGNLHKEGKLNLRRNFDYEDNIRENEDGTGREYNAGEYHNAYDGLEAKAAILEYLTKMAKQRNIADDDLDAYVNAMYNMGQYHKDLNDMDFVRKEYGFKPYYKLGGTHKMKVKDKGFPSTGKVKKAYLGKQFQFNFKPTTDVGKVTGWNGFQFNPTSSTPTLGINTTMPDYIGGTNIPVSPGVTLDMNTGIKNYTLPSLDIIGKGGNGTTTTPSTTTDKVSFLEANPNFLGDVIGAGANLIGNAVVAGINANTLKNLKYRPKPTPLQAAKLQTDVNYNPQYRAIEDSLARHKDYVNKNTASSATAGNRIRLAELEALKNSQLLRTNEINLESELLNKDAINAQTVVNSNITRNDEWRAGKTEFENAIKEGKAENANMAIQNSIDALIAPVNNLAQWRNTMSNVAAFSAANPNVSPELMDYYGLPYALYLKQKRESKNKNNRRG